MKLKHILTASAALAVATRLPFVQKKIGKRLSGALSKSALIGIAATTVIMATTAQAAISESSVQEYANAMRQAANSQNIGQISHLIADDAIISMTRQGARGGSSTLNKSNYLELLQKSWSGASGYHYDIQVSDVVISGDKARAQITTTETWTKDGKKVTLLTSSRATLGLSGGNTVLLLATSQVTIN